MNHPSPALTDLSNCDREPIHAPGSIQPHGFLFVLERKSWRVIGASSNAREFFWREASALIGSDIGIVLGDDVGPAIEQASKSSEFSRHPTFVKDVSIDIGGEQQQFTLVAHASGENIILEGERAANAAPLQIEQNLQTFLTRLATTESADELHRLAVAEIRRITGFDRCLLYQFDADWNGAVIAEDRNDALPKYLNQHFPASDIPKQARELYRRNRLRLIPTNNYRPIPIVMSASGTPATSIDLSLSVLRSVSPIHLEYMRNMGTGSSMSVAVMRDDQLWGLISCHSLQPRWVPFATRTACELLSQFLSLQLGAREQARELAYRVELTGTLTRLLSQMARAENMMDGAASDDLLRLANASGAALIEGDRIVLHGQTPSREHIAPLAEWLAQKNKALVFFDHLSIDYSPAQNFVDTASGLLAITLRESPRVAILWFRPELINVIEWGGEPRKAIETHGEGRTLHPRKSFEVWRETVRGHSHAWETGVVSIVREFRQLAGDLLLNPDDLSK